MAIGSVGSSYSPQTWSSESSESAPEASASDEASGEGSSEVGGGEENSPAPNAPEDGLDLSNEAQESSPAEGAESEPSPEEPASASEQNDAQKEIPDFSWAPVRGASGADGPIAKAPLQSAEDSPSQIGGPRGSRPAAGLDRGLAGTARPAVGLDGGCAPRGKADPALSARAAQRVPPRQQPSAFGEKLARDARRIAESGVAGKGRNCKRGVRMAFERNGMKLHGVSAYMAAGQLAKNKAFTEVKGLSREALKKLPPGATVVWHRAPGRPHGHISIATGNGREASDVMRNQITRYPSTYRVFLPRVA